jgi:peptidoglycan hydrolase-like protein with peptidoglycan-binding domain
MRKIIKLTESDLEKIVKRVLREDMEVEPEMANVPLDKVKVAQQALVNAGYNIGPTGVDGKFGKNTRAAVILYQKNNGIRQTGNVGPITAGKLGVQPLVSGTTTQKTATGQKPVQKQQTTTGQKPVQKQQTTTGIAPVQSQGCQVIGPSSKIEGLSMTVQYYQKMFMGNPYNTINSIMNKYASSYVAQGIPQRTACEIALIQLRPQYKDKNVFIVDTLDKLMYLYGKDSQFIAKTDIISGTNKQSVDPKTIAKSLMTWDEEVTSLGFKWVDGKGYVDQTGKNRKYNDELVYSNIDKNKARFLPKGIYTTKSEIGNHKGYAGDAQNVLYLAQGNKGIAQAIHGYYVEQPRTAALKKAAQVLSNPNNKKVSKEFMDLVSSKSVNLSQSYGCINVPENFLPYLRKYGPNSYVFNMGEDKQNYLVQNTTNYFDKMMNSESCPSPQSLGAIPVGSENIA